VSSPRGAHRILVVEDDEQGRRRLAQFLVSRGEEVVEASSCATARARIAEVRPDAALLDFRLPDGTALDLLEDIRACAPELPVLVLTGHGTIDLAVQAIKAGAEQFLTKPVDLDYLWLVLDRALQVARTRRRAELAAGRVSPLRVDPFRGNSPSLRQLADQAHRMAAAGRSVLLLGETGTGKSLLADWLHRNGPRRDEAFVDLNCATLSRELLESELFGYARGAFTGAVRDKPGLFEAAHRGTVFLDEIGDLELSVQPKLLKVLERRSLRRLGEVREREVNVQLVAATHRELRAMVAASTFREDLYFRISTITLRIPPLRERLEDLPMLAAEILQSLGAELGRPGLKLTPDALEALRGHAWPGNIRELRNALERAALLGSGDTLGPEVLHLDVPSQGAPLPDLTLAEAEAQLIQRALAREGGHVERAARRLGLSRSALYKKLARSFREASPLAD
jgi:DNA-binding NtrC family response regulator